jgi:hypothetical protein
MSTTLGFKTCEILAHLRARLPAAAVDYECVGAMHTFNIARDGLVYRVSFPEQVLTSRGEEELKRMLRPVIERAILGAPPHRVLVGTMADRGA